MDLVECFINFNVNQFQYGFYWVLIKVHVNSNHLSNIYIVTYQWRGVTQDG